MVILQVILVRERVLGPKHPEVSFYIRYRGAVYAGKFIFVLVTAILNNFKMPEITLGVFNYGNMH